MPDKSCPPKLLKATELAEALNGRYHPRTLVLHARNKWLPAIKGRGLWLFDLDEVMKKLNENAQPKA